MQILRSHSKSTESEGLHVGSTTWSNKPAGDFDAPSSYRIVGAHGCRTTVSKLFLGGREVEGSWDIYILIPVSYY